MYSIGIQWKYRYIETDYCRYLKSPLVKDTVLDRHHDCHAFGKSDIEEKKHERLLVSCSDTITNPTTVELKEQPNGQ